MRVILLCGVIATATATFVSSDQIVTAFSQARTGDLVSMMRTMVSEKNYKLYFEAVDRDGDNRIELTDMKLLYDDIINLTLKSGSRWRNNLLYNLNGLFEQLEFSKFDKTYNYYTFKLLVQRFHVAFARVTHDTLDENNDSHVSNDEVQMHLSSIKRKKNLFFSASKLPREKLNALFQTYLEESSNVINGHHRLLSTKPDVYGVVLVQAATSLRFIPELFWKLKKDQHLMAPAVKAKAFYSYSLCYPYTSEILSGIIQCTVTKQIKRSDVNLISDDNNVLYPDWDMSVYLKLRSNARKTHWASVFSFRGDAAHGEFHLDLVQPKLSNKLQLRMNGERTWTSYQQTPNTMFNFKLEQRTVSGKSVLVVKINDQVQIRTIVSPHVVSNFQGSMGGANHASPARGEYHHFEFKTEQRNPFCDVANHKQDFIVCTQNCEANNFFSECVLSCLRKYHIVSQKCSTGYNTNKYRYKILFS